MSYTLQEVMGITYNMQCTVKYGEGRSDRLGRVVGYTSNGDVRVRYDAGLEVTCRLRSVYLRYEHEILHDVTYTWWDAIDRLVGA